MQIDINRERCIRCLKCVKVCPATIFKGNEPEVERASRCIKCGHCVAVCPSLAVVHELFPEQKVHTTAYDAMPSSESLMLLIKNRRSMRNFTKTPIPDTLLEQIAQAAHRAPTATNAEQVSFTLITDPLILRQVSEFTVDTFVSAIGKIDNFIMRPIIKRTSPVIYKYIPMLKSMRRKLDEGNDQILRGATALLLIHTPKWISYGVEDCNLAYQNGSLMAEVLGVGQFYTGFVLNAAQRRKGALEKMLGIDGVIHAGMALGMPQFRYPNYIDRKDISLKKL